MIMYNNLKYIYLRFPPYLRMTDSNIDSLSNLFSNTMSLRDPEKKYINSIVRNEVSNLLIRKYKTYDVIPKHYKHLYVVSDTTYIKLS